MNDSGEAKSSSSQQWINLSENNNFGNVSFSDIYQDLLRDEERNTSRIVSPPKICVKTSSSCNNSNQGKSINTPAVLDSQGQEILKILEKLHLQGETELLFIITSALIAFMDLEFRAIDFMDLEFRAIFVQALYLL